MLVLVMLTNHSKWCADWLLVSEYGSVLRTNNTDGNTGSMHSVCSVRNSLVLPCTIRTGCHSGDHWWDTLMAMVMTVIFIYTFCISYILIYTLYTSYLHFLFTLNLIYTSYTFHLCLVIFIFTRIHAITLLITSYCQYSQHTIIQSTQSHSHTFHVLQHSPWIKIKHQYASTNGTPVHPVQHRNRWDNDMWWYWRV